MDENFSACPSPNSVQEKVQPFCPQVLGRHHMLYHTDAERMAVDGEAISLGFWQIVECWGPTPLTSRLPDQERVTETPSANPALPTL